MHFDRIFSTKKQKVTIIIKKRVDNNIISSYLHVKIEKLCFVSFFLLLASSCCCLSCLFVVCRFSALSRKCTKATYAFFYPFPDISRRYQTERYISMRGNEKGDEGEQNPPSLALWTKTEQ
jgi:hypothetical protein